MNNNDLFENENVKLRLIQLDYEYKNKFKDKNQYELEKVKGDFEADVRRIYSEETLQRLPEYMEIFTSSEIIKNNKNFDGSVIHSWDKKMVETLIISKPMQWDTLLLIIIK